MLLNPMGGGGGGGSVDVMYGGNGIGGGSP